MPVMMMMMMMMMISMMMMMMTMMMVMLMMMTMLAGYLCIQSMALIRSGISFTPPASASHNHHLCHHYQTVLIFTIIINWNSVLYYVFNF